MTWLGKLRNARNAQSERLAGHPNVVGTGLGVKRRAGQKITNAAVIVFVRQKLPLDRLSADQRLPPAIEYAGETIPIDVVEVAGIRSELGSAPYSTSDRVKKGTVSAFAKSDGIYHAVTCAHCLRGRDGNSYTNEPIDLWDAAGIRYIPGGENGFAIHAPGLGLPGNFGFSDIGLVTLEDRDLLRLARAAGPFGIAGRIQRGASVTAQTPTATIIGSIDAVEAVIDRVRIDLVIHMPNQGTIPGNSGMMWRTKDGSAIGVHALGLFTDNSDDSRYSLCMTAKRAAEILQVQFLDPGWRDDSLAD